MKSYLDEKLARDAAKRAQDPRAIVESCLDEEPNEHAAQLQDERDRMADPFAQDDHDKPATKLITLSQSDIVTAMRSVQPKIQACANQFKVTGTARANISVASGGKVTSATVTGKFSGTPTGSCVETAAKSAEFPPCMPTNFPWPFTLSPR